MATQLATELHDLMLSFKPSGVEHPSDCPLCAVEDGATADTEGGVMSDPTYTQEELDAAVAAAVKEIQARLEMSETQESFAKEKEALEARIEELQVQLDKAVLETEQAKTDGESVLAFLTQAKADEEEAEQKEAKKNDRKEKMKKYAFQDEYVEANAERWAAMSDEQFDAYLADLESSGARKSEDTESTEEEIPAETAMTATAADTKKANSGLLQEVLSMKLRGIDPNTV